jgi:hypothetical protein
VSLIEQFQNMRIGNYLARAQHSRIEGTGIQGKDFISQAQWHPKK